MRFTIRDLLWLTLVAALSLGWWRSSIPKAGGQVIRGYFLDGGKPVEDARVFVHSPNGQFRGTNVVKGVFFLDIPFGKYSVTFDGKDVPANRFDLEVRPEEIIAGIAFDLRFSAPSATADGSAETLAH
jgi:hypothetical protein